MTRKLTLVLLLGVLGLSSGLRLWGSRWGLPNQERLTTLYVDEYNPFFALSQMDPAALNFNPGYFINPSFFYYQVGVVLKTAAVLRLVKLSSDRNAYLADRPAYARLYFAARLLVIAYGILLTYLIFRIGVLVASPGAGLIAAFLYAVVPVSVISTHVADPGVPVAAWLAGAWLCVLIALHHQNARWLYAASLAAGFAFSTKYTSGPFAICILHALIVLRPGWRPTFLILALGPLAFLLGTPYAVLDFPAFWNDFRGVIFNHVVRDTTPIHTFLAPVAHFGYALGYATTLISLLGIGVLALRQSRAAVSAVCFLVPFLFSLGRSDFHITRYLNEPLPFLLPFAGAIIAGLIGTSNRPKQVAAFALLLLCCTRLPYTFAINRSLAAETDPRDQASVWIRGHLPAGTHIGLEHEANFMAPGHLFMQYWKGKRYPEEAIPPPTYSLSVWDKGAMRWPEGAPNYLVGSNLYYSGLGRKHRGQAEEARQQGEAMRRGYEPLMHFRRDVRWGPFRYELPDGVGWDWVIFLPEITVYRRTDLPPPVSKANP